MTHGCIRGVSILAGQIKKKQRIDIKRDEINIMNIINDSIFNLHESLFSNDNRYMKGTLKSKLIGNTR